MPEPLRPCPHNGHTEWLFRSTRGNYHWIECAECGSRGPICETKAAAILAWNTRPGEDALRNVLQAARDALSETIQRIGNGYDWNADPDYITLKQGEAFTAIDAALNGGANG